MKFGDLCVSLQILKKFGFALLAFLLVSLATGCQKNDEPETRKKVTICEVGNTGKLVSSCNVSTGSSTTFASNITYALDDYFVGHPSIRMLLTEYPSVQ